MSMRSASNFLGRTRTTEEKATTKVVTKITEYLWLGPFLDRGSTARRLSRFIPG